MSTQREVNTSVAKALVIGIGLLAKSACGWKGVLVYSWGIVVGGVGTMYMHDMKAHPPKVEIKTNVDNSDEDSEHTLA